MILKEVKTEWPPKVMAAMKNMCQNGFPHEVCGVIHSHGIVRQLPNTFCGDKRHGFDMELDLADKSIRAIWHSHPLGPSYPSQDDLPAMRLLADHGFFFPWIIVTPVDIKEYVGLQID